MSKTIGELTVMAQEEMDKSGGTLNTEAIGLDTGDVIQITFPGKEFAKVNFPLSVMFAGSDEEFDSMSDNDIRAKMFREFTNSRDQWIGMLENAVITPDVEE